jgi:hypothetical protein
VLTARQEAELLMQKSGVVVIGGTELAGIGDWRKCARQATEVARSRRGLQVELQALSKPMTFERFKGELSRLESRADATLRILAVSQDAEWTPEWVKEARRRFTGAATSKQHRRVIFIANAARAWTWTADVEDRTALLAGNDGSNPVVEMVVGPWSRTSLDLWLDTEDHIGLLPDWLINHRNDLLTGTGGWATMLERLAEAPRGGKELPAHLDGRALADSIIQMRLESTDPLAELAAMPSALPILAALSEAEDLIQRDETIDERLSLRLRARLRNAALRTSLLGAY